jgi:uncharacterized repeat protein (TIGR01451 family)/fimbrial isopeptide formation D2 family protein
LLTIGGFSAAQAGIAVTSTNNAATLSSAIQGPGTTITNLSVSQGSTTGQTGTFTSGNVSSGPGPVFEMSTGAILYTGTVGNAIGPNNSTQSTTGNASDGFTDTDLLALTGGTGNCSSGAPFAQKHCDVVTMQFDVQPTGSFIELGFIFGSEEYPEYVCSAFNDAMGIFVSGPGISGTYSNSAINIAQLPNGARFTINDINRGTRGEFQDAAVSCDLGNSAFYNENSRVTLNTNGFAVDNLSTATHVNAQQDGFTDRLVSLIVVSPNQTYRVKVALADVGDRQWDSSLLFGLVSAFNADFGDAPASYGTELVNSSGIILQSAVFHRLGSDINIGANAPDHESNGQMSVLADGDGADEDGIASFPAINQAATSFQLPNIPVRNNTGNTATLIGWIDFDRNGSFQSDEAVTATVPSGASSATLTWTTAAAPGMSGMNLGQTYARLRLTTDTSVTTATPDTAANDGEVEDYVLTIGLANLSTSTKTVVDLNGGDVYPGDVLRYTISLNNTGDASPLSLAVTDDMPAYTENFSVVSLPASAVDNSTGAGTGTNGTGYLNATNITVAAGGSETVVFDVTVRDDAPLNATIANSAVVSVTGGTGGTPAAPNLTVLRVADLSISKQDASTQYTPGGTTVYTLLISNAGPHHAYAVTVNDVLPNGVSINGSWSCDPAVVPGDGSASCITGQPGGTVASGSGTINQAVDIPAGKSLVFTVPVQFAATTAPY